MNGYCKPLNLLDLKEGEFQKFLDQFDHVFSDCDGVIWCRTIYPGVGLFFSLMQKLGKTVSFVSNNSMRPQKVYEERFELAGIENGYKKLTVPSLAIAEYLKSINFNKKLYCVTCAETIKVLKEHGFQCVYGPDVAVDWYGDFIEYLEDDEDIGAVVFDSDFKVNLPKLYKASTYLNRPEVLFINGATDRTVPLKPDVLTMGTGVFTDLVSDQVKREPIQLGKPGKVFGEFAMKRAGVSNASRVLFIGDMIEQDIGLGKATGFKTLFVHTSRPLEAMLSHPKLRSDFYAPDLGSIVPLLEKALKTK